MNKNNKIIVIVGPTASGKSAVAMELAKLYGGEIICGDSMQIYKDMNIGTAKPSPEDMEMVPHHLFDIISLDKNTSFNVAEYVKLARAAAADILSRGAIPIVCGGTGLYIDSFIKNNEFAECENDYAYRLLLEETAQKEGVGKVHAMLREVDPESAALIHPNNLRRVIRALEIHRLTGVKKSELDRRSRLKRGAFDFIKIGLFFNERSTLYDRIDKRCDGMISSGWVDETERLISTGYGPPMLSTGAIGYKEIADYIAGNITLTEAAEQIKMATRQYAKRQITWFKRDAETKWVESGVPVKNIIEKCKEHLNKFINL